MAFEITSSSKAASERDLDEMEAVVGILQVGKLFFVLFRFFGL